MPIYVFVLQWYKPYTVVSSFEAILIILFCIFYFADEIREPQTSFVYNTSTFWIVCAIFFYVAGTFFLSLYLELLPEAEKNKYWSINLAFNILKNLLFAIAIIIHAKHSDNMQPLHKQRQPFLN